MACNLGSVPAHLQWNGKPIYTEADFANEHNLYRLTIDKNPLTFPSGQTTGISCKWSFIIAVEDLFKVENPKGVNSYYLAVVSDILSCFKSGNKDDGGTNLGWHKLTCIISHTPIECDYSHCEINVRHQIFEDSSEHNLLSEAVYTSDAWEACMLNSKSNKFIKTLRKDYRLELIKKFALPT